MQKKYFDDQEQKSHYCCNASMESKTYTMFY